MQARVLDTYDWSGCEWVQHDENKLNGRGTVMNLRMDADGILENFNDGLTVEEIVDSYGVPKDAVEGILRFAALRGLRATA